MAEIKIKTPDGNNHVSLTTANASGDGTVTLPKGGVDLNGGSDGQFLKTNGSGTLSFATVSSPVTALNNATANELVTVGSTTTELDAESGLTFDGTHLSITDGDLKIATAGHGIDFSATADSAGTSTSEVLKDYEVGTWTPAFTNAPTTSSVSGSYIKIGDMVFAYWTFTTSNDGPASHARINNLPFTSTAANPPCGGTAWDYRTNSAINAYQSPATTSLYFYHQNGTVMMGDSAEFENEEFRGCTIYQTA